MCIILKWFDIRFETPLPYTTVKKNKGIVLRNYPPTYQKYAIFDEQLGKIECIIDAKIKKRFSNGAIITYSYRNKGHYYLLNDIELIDIPFALARNDILFFHHILEICYYFLPLESYAGTAFHLVHFLFTACEQFNAQSYKNLFLYKLFCSLGIHPEESFCNEISRNTLISKPIEVILKETIDNATNNALEAWLMHCTLEHPNKDQFKTLYFNKDST